MLEFESALEFLGGFLPPDIESLDIPFAAVATDLMTGDEVVTRTGSIVDAIAGSCSIPGVFPPLRNDGGWLADGALVNPLPVSAARCLGASFVIAIDVSVGSRIGDVRAAMRHVEFFASLRRWLAFWGLSRAGSGDKPPREHLDVDTVLRKAEEALARSAALREVAAPPEFTITVPLEGFRVFDFHRAKELVDLGRVTARQEIGALRRAIDARAS
jgi:NTE family protein